MKVYFTDQAKNFPQHLEYLKKQPVMQYDKSQLVEKITVINLATKKELQKINTDLLFDYKIFPNRIMTYLTQWVFENRGMKIGDTIVQQAFIPPLRYLSQKIIFGVRIKDIISEPTRIGFSYETIKGHVEKGISTFTIERADDQKTIFKIHTFSQPGNLLTKLVGRIVSIPYQTFCTRQGLLNVKHQIDDFQEVK